MLSAALWEAVALSVNVNPDVLRAPIRTLRFRDPVRFGPKEFKSRLEVAINHHRNEPFSSMRAAVRPGYESWHDDVGFREFAEWACKLGWTIPDEFPEGKPPSFSLSEARGVKGVGRPSAMDKVLAEFERRIVGGTVENRVSAEATALAKWWEQMRRDGDPPALNPATIEKHINVRFKEARNSPPKK